FLVHSVSSWVFSQISDPTSYADTPDTFPLQSGLPPSRPLQRELVSTVLRDATSPFSRLAQGTLRTYVRRLAPALVTVAGRAVNVFRVNDLSQNDPLDLLQVHEHCLPCSLWVASLHGV